MKKSEVEFHADSWARGGSPAVNVKVYGSMPAVHEDYGDGFSREWIEEHISEEELADWWQFACESNWECLEADAQELWGAHVKVYSEGRSGGWAVPSGIPDFEGWDAIELGRWSRFAKWARMHADDVPHQMVSLIYINVYDPIRHEAKVHAEIGFYESAH